MTVLKGQPPRTAADDEPTSRADKARGASPNKYAIYKIINTKPRKVKRRGACPS